MAIPPPEDAAERDPDAEIDPGVPDVDLSLDFDLGVPDVDADLAQPPVDVSLVPQIIIPLFLGISLLCLGIAAIAGVQTQRAIAREVTTQGRVVDVAIRKGRDGKTTYAYPTVEFVLPNERRQTLELGGGSVPSRYQPGESVTIAYDPERPHHARIPSLDSTIGLWILPTILGFLGAGFGGGTLLALWIIKSDWGNTR